MRLVGKWPTKPGESLYRAVRAAFALKGTDLGTWCKKNGVRTRAWARSALRGTRTGPAAQALRERIVKDAKGDAS